MTVDSELQALWDRSRPLLEPALEHSFGYDIDAVWAEIQDPDTLTHLWPGERSAVVTQVWLLPRARAVNIWLCGGDMDELIHGMLPCIEAWARAIGCTDIFNAGRPGWARVLKTAGYSTVAVALRKELQ